MIAAIPAEEVPEASHTGGAAASLLAAEAYHMEVAADTYDSREADQAGILHFAA